MTMTMKKLAAGAMGLGLAISLSSCGSDAADSPSAGKDCTAAHPGLETVRDGALTVATYNFPPFVELAGETAAGVEGDILNEIAAMECLTVGAQPLDTGSVISATQSGRTDIAAGNWYCTAERDAEMSLVGPVYGDLVGIISMDGATTFEEIEGKPMGSVDGYLWNEEFQSIYGSDLKLYPNPTAMYNDLKSGRIEVAADSLGSAAYANEQNGDAWTVEAAEPDERVASSQQPPQVCFPMAKANESLFRAVTDDLNQLRADGTIADILEKNGLDPAAADSGELRLIQ